MNDYNFIFKPFDEMTPEDYERVGFKSGLEVHQQLLTEKKLFCRDPAGIYTDKFNTELLRHMRPTLSELGEYDGTALMEFKTKKEIIYRVNYDNVCTYEIDDTPPFMINDEALDIAFEVGLLYNANIVDELHIARKQYLDGSIPTGFQRTAITCVGGYVPYKGRKINLIQMSIEEDSCREISDIGHRRIYNTDRLGMPLIESVTYPEMKTPQEVADVNDILRKLVRSTGRVRTGMGAGREDVNVSVRGGTRIEIKGVPNIKRIPLLCYNEAMRQWNLLRLREELKNRGVTEATFQSEVHDITKIIRKTRYQPIADAAQAGQVVNCVVLKGYNGLLKWKTQTDTFFSQEISDRVRVIACLTRLPNIIHSDSPTENIASADWRNIYKTTGATKDDALVLVWGLPEDAEMGAGEIIIRAKEATIGIPSETRQAFRDGTNGFERILPGPSRMYPDTDLPPVEITEERLERLRNRMPERIWERAERYKKMGLTDDVIEGLYISEYAGLFDKAVSEYGVEPEVAAKALIQSPKRLRREKYKYRRLNAEIFDGIFKALGNGEIVKEAVHYILRECTKSGDLKPEMLIKPASNNEILKRIETARSQMQKIELLNPEMHDKVMMGLIMDDLRGRVNGSEVEKLINENNQAEK